MKKKALIALLVLFAIGLLLGPRVHGQGQVVSLGSNGIDCIVTVSTATTIQAVGGNCVAPGAGLRIYITDVNFGTNAAGIAADSFPTLKTGTGGTCGSNTSVVWQAFSPAATQNTVDEFFTTPIRLPFNQELCWIDSTAGSKELFINGYIGP